MRTSRVLVATIAMLCVVSLDTVQPQMIADITEDIHTDFGTYHPYPAPFTPSVAPFTVESDFGNVSNFSQFSQTFTPIDSILLVHNHFAVKKRSFKQLYDVYNGCTLDNIPIFVTTDAVLHIYHVLFDHFLAEIEVQRFVEILDRMSEALMVEAQNTFTRSTNPETKEAARRNLAFLSVGKKLLPGIDTEIPEAVSALVNSELDLISSQDGFHYSPIFGSFSALDYSQFNPRGHYTRSDTLEAYFKAMMWYSWTIFTVEPDLFGDLARRHTLQALMLVQLLYNIEENGRPLIEAWRSIYEPTVFFVGKTDDLTLKDYRAIGDHIYGPDFLSLSPDSLANANLLATFMTEAQKLPEPKIPNVIYGTGVHYKGFRFMGQRLIPDSYMFSNLIFPSVGTGGNPRLMPKGLDLMAILGSDRAYTLLDSVYHETSYANYSEMIARFKNEFSAKPHEEWSQNLYWNWLYCLMPLLYDKGPGYPFFMQTSAWSDKELTAALASWAELRHDTILYAKQSIGPVSSRPKTPPQSYVEPNPYLYARLASLVRYTGEGLRSCDLLLDGFQARLDIFETLLLFLRDISIKELQNTPLSESEYDDIYCFGWVMEHLVTVSDNPLLPGNTDDMAVVADVHTDASTNLCLEEGVGYPLGIYVIVNEGGVIRITCGAVFSYYEFPQPISQRLTDEEWRELLTGGSPPSMPEWARSFVDMASSQPPISDFHPGNNYYGVFDPEIIQFPSSICLLQNYPNPFNPETTIRFELVTGCCAWVEIYNVLGQKVKTLVDEFKIAGSYDVMWNGTDAWGRDVSSGVYLCRLRAGNVSQVNKMLLIR